MYGLFSVVSAQNQITHALIQASKSLSLDSYLTENVESAAEEGPKFWGGLSDMVLDFVRLDNNEYFTSKTDWYKTESGDTTVAKARFIGYLAGGDINAAHEKLKSLGIVNGINGINFEMKVEDEEMTITIKYEIKYLFDFWGMGKFPMEQSITTRLWM